MLAGYGTRQWYHLISFWCPSVDPLPAGLQVHRRRQLGFSLGANTSLEEVVDGPAVRTYPSLVEHPAPNGVVLRHCGVRALVAERRFGRRAANRRRDGLDDHRTEQEGCEVHASRDGYRASRPARRHRDGERAPLFDPGRVDLHADPQEEGMETWHGAEPRDSSGRHR